MKTKSKTKTSVLNPHTVKGYGWVPDFPDQRDFLYAAPPHVLMKLPPKVDLRKNCPAVYDQGQLGSCTANAIAGAIEFDQIKQNLEEQVPSRLFIYYNERVIEHTVNSDAGAMIRDGIKSVNKIGACDEVTWPYDITKFTDKPDQKSYTEAKKHLVVGYQRLVPTLNQLKGCLAEGFPFVFGFSVYEAFETPEVAKTGDLNMPSTTEKLLGGHAVLAVGYDDEIQKFIIRNSWGNKWGKKGYFTMPYNYLTDSNLSDDFWTIRLVK